MNFLQHYFKNFVNLSTHIFNLHKVIIYLNHLSTYGCCFLITLLFFNILLFLNIEFLLFYYSTTIDELQKILGQIEKASTSDKRKASITQLDEIVRLATIAADECDFGTCLELGHDFFSNGSIHVQGRALQMLSIAYTHLQRPQLLEILKAHLKNRRKGCELSVI